MRSLASFAALLAGCDSVDALSRLASELGCRGLPLPLDPDALEALGLRDAHVGAARIVTGAGAIRVLLVECTPRPSLRDALATIAARLAAAAPQALWLVLAVHRGTRDLAVASWAADRRRPRVAALVIDRARIMPSDAETLAALAGAARESDVVAHALWNEALGREGLGRRFYRALERVVAALAREARGRASADERAELALLHVSRLLFLSFLETKGWLDGERRFLELGFARCMEGGGDYHGRVLLPLFFGTLNTPVARRAAAARALGRIPFLNGGLFARTALERRRADVRFPDDAMGLVFSELLARYRFTAREEGTTWSEAAIDPEMLGRAFESLMAAAARLASGAFFTPQALVARLAHEAIAEALSGGGLPRPAVDAAIAGDTVDRGAAALLRERVRALRVLDPACGSGAFLVHALETLSALLRRCGDDRSVAATRRELVMRAIFGVDVNPVAVWLCELRLWLSVVIESGESDPLAVPPLPNLDRNVRVGDALAGEGFDDARPVRGGAELARLRERYARATGQRKRTLERALDAGERALAVTHVEKAIARCAARRRDLLASLRGRDLFGERIQPATGERERLAVERARSRELHAARRALRDGGALPFAWATHFPDVARRGGFDVVLGNPPWVRLHRIPAEARAALRARFACFRAATWERGAAAARAGPGFAAQVDLAALFTERSLTLLRDEGALALLLPMKLWRSLSGGGLRRFIHERARLVALEDWSEAPAAFDAVVYPSMLVARRASPAAGPRDEPARAGAPGRSSDADVPARDAVLVAVHASASAVRYRIHRRRLALDDDPASPWLPLPPPARDAFDRITRAGVPLSGSPLGAPLLGVKCGCNDAFVVEWQGDGDETLARVHAGGRRTLMERALLRPLLRGEHVAAWSPTASAEWIVWTHGDDGAPLPVLPPHAARWLAHWRRRLVARADARRSSRWWTLFRTAAASALHTRVVWADVARVPRALVLPAGDGTVPLNSCYVFPCPDPGDALAIAALLNSPLAAAWLTTLAEPARGRFRRFLAWTVALLPVPRDWERARMLLVPLAARAVAGDPPAERELLAAALRAYRLRPADVEPLLAWCAR